jgi:hypothetical protein
MLYKITAADGSSCHGGTGKWTPNRWRSVKGKLVPCENGLHLCEVADLPKWLRFDGTVWEAETDGETIRADDKTVARRARITRKVGILNHRLLVEWACLCAERVLPEFEKKYPKDDRPRKAIETARKVAAGELPSSAYAAASSAAYAAAASAAYAAASSAAYAAAYASSAYAAASSAAAASAAAYAANAAYDAANDAANAAAYADAARQQEQGWQGQKLLELLAAQETA